MITMLSGYFHICYIHQMCKASMQQRDGGRAKLSSIFGFIKVRRKEKQYLKGENLFDPLEPKQRGSEATFDKTQGSVVLLWLLDCRYLKGWWAPNYKYALSNLKWMAIRRARTTASVSRQRAHLLRDGRELVVSLKCHIHQLGRQGDRALSRREIAH